jgi:hypothetical protein
MLATDPGWNQPKGAVVGHDPSSNPTWVTIARLFLELDINPQFFGPVEY